MFVILISTTFFCQYQFLNYFKNIGFIIIECYQGNKLGGGKVGA